MATHGKAREATLEALRTRTPFKRSGFAMQAVEGGTLTLDRLGEPYRHQYVVLREAQQIAYTVLSYSTPIAWVTTGGTIVIPDETYSRTTTHHQGLCKVYL